MTTLAYLIVTALAFIGALTVIALAAVALIVWDADQRAKETERQDAAAKARWLATQDARWAEKAGKAVDKLITECGGKVPS